MKKILLAIFLLIPSSLFAMSYDSGEFGVSTTSVLTLSVLNVTSMTVTGTFNPAGSTVTLSGTVFNGQKIDNSTTTYTGFNIFKGSTTIKGVTAATNAATGDVGEYISSVTANPTLFPNSGSYGDLLAITLTAGDWDVTGAYEGIANGATVQQIRCGISTTANNSGTGLVDGDNLNYAAGPTAVNVSSVYVNAYRVSINATTIHYLKIQGTFSVATPTALGRISARRVR